MSGGVGHAEADRLCRRCGEPVRLTGGGPVLHPLLPGQMRKAEHEGGGEMCAGGEDLAAPITPDLVSGL